MKVDTTFITPLRIEKVYSTLLTFTAWGNSGHILPLTFYHGCHLTPDFLSGVSSYPGKQY